MAIVCGVDSSTQSTKVVLRDLDTGAVVATRRAPHPPTQPPRSEQDPGAWWSALRAALAEAMAGAGVRHVDSIAVAAQQHGLVALDGRREVIRPAKLWNDTESAPQTRALVDALGPDAWAKACGSVPVPAFTISKLAWLRDREPASYRRLAHVLLPHDWLTMRLCGSLVTDRGDASGTGYWSPHDGAWRTELLALVDRDRDWAAALPEVRPPREPAGAVTAPAAADLTVNRRGVVGPGTGDNMAAALGLGLAPGDVVVSLGTSGTVFAVSPTPTADPSGAVAGFADATGRFLPLVCTLNATKVTDAFARLLGVDPAGLDRLALDAPPGAGGLTLLPYLDGERTPDRPDATGLLAGLRTDVSREQVARAAVEGVVCGLLDGLDALTAAGVDTGGRLLLVGGGAHSAAYGQVLADLAQRPVHAFSGLELVALGAAVQAAGVLLDDADVVVDEVASAWRPEPTAELEPESDDGAAKIRARYAGVRDM